MDLEQLHANRETLHAEWMKRVNGYRAAGFTHETVHAVGPILGKDNSLVMFVYVHGRRDYDLRIDADGHLRTEYI